MPTKTYSLDSIRNVIEAFRTKDKIIGFSSGVFENLSPGIIRHLQEAREMCDFLIVGLEARVRKDGARDEEIVAGRIAMVSSISFVDAIVLIDDMTALEIIQALRPNLYFKGQIDPAYSSDSYTIKLNQERSAIETLGGRLIFTGTGASAGSNIALEDPGVLDYLRDIFKADLIHDTSNYFSTLNAKKVMIIGEAIVDQYTQVTALGKSSKDPLLAFQLGPTSSFPGGVLSIANICSEWVAKVTVVTNGKERDLSAFSSSKQNIELRLLESDRPTIKKHRFIDLASHHKVFEYYDFDSTDLGNSEIQEFLLLLSDIDSFDLVIVADFGHGVLVDKIRDLIVNKSRYLCVNTQANAGNRGFNTISKYKRADLFALNSGELQLELRNRNPNYKNVVPKIMKTMGSHRCILTLGGSGLLVFDEHGYIHAPALALRVVDKVGAGDAVFACASLLSSASMPSSLIGLVCNMIAAHEVNQLGHHSALNPAILLDQVNRVFGQVRERIERPL